MYVHECNALLKQRVCCHEYYNMCTCVVDVKGRCTCIHNSIHALQLLGHRGQELQQSLAHYLVAAHSQNPASSALHRDTVTLEDSVTEHSRNTRTLCNNFRHTRTCIHVHCTCMNKYTQHASVLHTQCQACTLYMTFVYVQCTCMYMYVHIQCTTCTWKYITLRTAH